MVRSNLSAVSLGCMASGPEYTYCSGEVRTTVDNILMDVEATSLMSSCRTHTMEDLNTSDHLPLMASLMYNSYSSYGGNTSTQDLQVRIDWDQARKTGETKVFANEVQIRLAPFLNSLHKDGDEMDEDVEQVAVILTDCAELLPCAAKAENKVEG